MLYGRPEEDAGLFTRKAGRVRDLAVADVVNWELLVAFVALLAALVTALVYGWAGRWSFTACSRSARWWRCRPGSAFYGPLNDVSGLPLEIVTALVALTASSRSSTWSR